MRRPLAVLLVFVLGSHFSVFADQSKTSMATLTDRLNGSWTKLQVGFAIDRECTGIIVPESFMICRQGDLYTLYGVSSNDEGSDHYTSGRELKADQYMLIVAELLVHFKTAADQVNTSEYFESLPEAQREKELTEYFKIHGRPIGGFEGEYIFVRFYPGGFMEGVIMNGFSKNESFNDLIECIQKIAKNEKR